MILALFLFAPLMAGWAHRGRHGRVGQGDRSPRRSTAGRASQFSPIGVIVLLAVGVVSPTFSVALEFAVGLLVTDALLLRFVSGMFDRERLVTGTKAV